SEVPPADPNDPVEGEFIDIPGKAGVSDPEIVDEPVPVTEDDLDMSQITADDLVTLLDERDQFLDAYRRSQADFENFRKAAQKRQGDEVSRVLGRFVEGLLPVLDAGDAAIAHGAEGATEVFTALLGALEKQGLQRVDPLGEPFDPNVAEAVLHEPGDGGEQVVAEVLRVGYLWNERVLRPAMVKVKD
ncbi:MAG TPA: nucleotide exchange factor GrpE, partial [Acidimicrobiia bacterium]|nr:nucleotide exchange factor GrpE [Acidimicrobiia bacterium]